MKSGIYKILNNVTEKFYLGSAVNFKARWTQHKSKLRLNVHPNKYLQASWNLHGNMAFEFIILEYVERDKIPEREQYWLDELKPYDREIGYNLYKIAGSPLGTKWTEERKEKARKRMLGFKHSEASKAKMKEIKSFVSDETRAKISASKLGHIVLEETKQKIGSANLGKKRTEEALLKMRSKTVSDEVKLRISKSLRKLDKWPCAEGSLCKCRECSKKKSDDLYYRRHRNNSNVKIENNHTS